MDSGRGRGEDRGRNWVPAIRKVVTQIHLCAPSVVGLSVPDAEVLLKEIEDEVLEQLHTLGERLSAWKKLLHPLVKGFTAASRPSDRRPGLGLVRGARHCR